MNGTALVGKASQIFGATLHYKLADSSTDACFRSSVRHVYWIPSSRGRMRRNYSAACSSGATRGKMIWIRVPPPGSESRSSRPPSRLVTML